MKNPRRRGDEYEKHLEGKLSTDELRKVNDLREILIKEAKSSSKRPIEIILRVDDESIETDDTEASYDLTMTGESFQRVKGSGSTPQLKGDLKSKSYLMQAKRTNNKSFTVKLDDLRKAEMEAMNREKKPLFMVGFYDGDKLTDEWVLVPKWAL